MLVKHNKPRVLSFHGVRIIPGINDIPAELVAQMQEDCIIAAKFDCGELEIIGRAQIGAKSAKSNASGVELLLAADLKKAKALAAQTVDLAMLEEWEKRETRSTVRQAVSNQITKITKIEFRKSGDKTEMETPKEE